MRASIAFLTSTAATVAAPPLPTVRGAHRLDVLGFHRGERAIYLREEVGAALPIIHVVRTRGEHAGRMVAMRSWYDPGDDDSPTAIVERLGERLIALAGELVPIEEI